MKDRNIGVAFTEALRVALISCAILFAFQSCFYSQVPAWHKVKSGSGGFQVEFPQQPKYSSDSVADGAIPSYVYELETATYNLFISYVDFPGLDETILQREVDVLAGGFLKFLKYTQISRSEITQKGCQGIEIHSKGLSNRIGTLRIFRSGQRYFLLSVTRPAKNRISDIVSERFLNSFEVSDGCKGVYSPVEAPPEGSKTVYLDGILDTKTGWRRIHSDDGQFDALMPTRVEEEIKQVMIKPIPITLRIYSASDAANVYLVDIRGDFPSDMITPKNRDSQLDILEKSLREEFADKYGTKVNLTLVRNLVVGGYPGREFSLSSEVGGEGFAQIFVVPKRSYVFIVAGEKGQYNSELARRFLGSIRITVN